MPHPRKTVRAEQAGGDPGAHPHRRTAESLNDSSLPLLINASAPRAREVVEAVRKSGLGIAPRSLAADEVAAALEELAASGVRRVAVAGGDGTIALAAEIGRASGRGRGRAREAA